MTDTTQRITSIDRARPVAAWAASTAAGIGGLITGVYLRAHVSPTTAVRSFGLAAIVVLALVALVVWGSRRTVDAVLAALDDRAMRNRSAVLDVRQQLAEHLAAVTAEVARLRGESRIELRELAEAVQRVEARLTADIEEAYRLGAQSVR